MYNANEFMEWRKKQSKLMHQDENFQASGLAWMNSAARLEYSYMFQWLGVPVIQFPSDLFLIQEAIYKSKANKIIEIGIARGGTTLFLASILELMGDIQSKKVIGVDISISTHTHDAIKNSKFVDMIELVEGNSVNSEVVAEVAKKIEKNDRNLVILDSNHAADHVYQELMLYSCFVSAGSFLIVMDTAIEYLDENVISKEKPWSRGNSPHSAIEKFMLENADKYILDDELNSRSFPGAAKGGFLRRKEK